jgi:Family of unknown function (DUF6580)
MKSDRQTILQDLLVFFLLIGIGVAGRWGQPQWCFTPTAAAAIFAGWYFSRLAVAVLVPISVLAISDLLLPAYNSIPVLLATYIVMTLPVGLGRLQRGSQSRWRAAAQWVFIGLVPASLFYIVTNFAVWAFQSDYEKSLAGLAQCYWAAVPFYRWMLAGDVFYLSVLLSCVLIAGAPAFIGQRASKVAG